MYDKRYIKTFPAFRRVTAVIMCLLVMSIVLPISIFADAADARKTVRVGFHEPPYFTKDNNGSRSGYSYEYQRKVAAYTGWKYEYVEGSWSELLQKLKDGEIDLMSNVSYSEERAEYMLYSSIPMGTESYYVFVSPDNTEITPDSISSLNGKRVGVTEGSIQKEYFIEWAERNGIKVDIIEKNGTDEDTMQLLGKEFDAFVTIEVYGTPDTAVPLWKIGSSDFYFAVNKDRSDLLEELNFALNSIQDENKYYDQQLHDEYLKISETNRFLNITEKEWLKGHGKIRVGYQDNYLAFCGKDPDSGKLTGALKDYLSYASSAFENADPQFEAVAYDTVAEAIDALKNGEIDCMFPAELTACEAEKMGLVMSQPVMSTELLAVVRTAGKDEFLQKDKVCAAVNEGNINYDLFLSTDFPEWDRKYYSDTSSVLKAVANREADCVLISSYRYSNISKQCDKLHLSTVDTGKNIDYCFAVREGDIQLYSILAKVTGVVPDSAVHTALTYYSTESVKTSIVDIIRENLFVVLTVILSVTLVIVILILRNIRADINAQKKAKEHRRIADDLSRRVYVDALTSVRNKGGYTDYMGMLQESVESGEKTEFAVCMFDCDDLKYINDNYGHEKGDEYLKSATHLICSIFRHSPVFRIGGDEFTVVLQNEDYMNREELVRMFGEECRSINSSVRNEWEHVSVSLGMAEYDPDIDSSVEDTANRADEKMYDNKRERKAGRDVR